MGEVGGHWGCVSRVWSCMSRCCTDHHVRLPVIPACLDTELTEFPLRMRDWLKNVLITLYERDEDNNLLTEKQKLKVRGWGGNLEAHPTNRAQHTSGVHPK